MDTLKLGPIGSPETSIINQFQPQNNPEDRRTEINSELENYCNTVLLEALNKITNKPRTLDRNPSANWRR
jgi:hypothetical protein